MLYNYLKTGFRNVIKNKLSSFINILGLGMATGCAIVVFVFLDRIFTMDQFNHKLDRIQVIERIATHQNGKEIFLSESPIPMGNLLKQKFPQIKNSVRIKYSRALVKKGDEILREEVAFLDDSFYNMFDFPIKWGIQENLTSQNGIVLSETTSEKLYGSEDPVGKTLNLIFTKDGKDINEVFTITGVLEDKTLNTSFHFNAAIPFSRMVSMGLIREEDWTTNTEINFLELDSKSSKMPTTDQCRELLELYNHANQDSKITSFHFQPLQGMLLHSYKLNYSRFSNTHLLGIILLISIATGILLIAFFNYMNIAIASASGRLKEIGIRKVIGSERKQIMFQFITENLILCTMGVLFGLLLSKGVFLPWFSKTAASDLSTGMFTNIHVWIGLLALVILSILGGAFYPSIYISSLQPVSIVKGKLGLSNKNRLRKILLGFQFCITFLGISMALAFVREYTISKTISWGYDPGQTLVVKLNGSDKFELFSSAIMNSNQILSVSGSKEAIGYNDEQMAIRIEGQEQKVISIHAIGGLATHMGIPILNGRDLNKNYKTDASEAVIVNQAFVKANHWSSAVGKSIEYNGKKYSIVGETNDFRYKDFEHPVEALVIMACKSEDVNYVYIKLNGTLTSKAQNQIQATWKQLFPDKPFEYYYQDNVFDNYYFGFAQVINILTASSFVMILVSICGIFGLALLILSRKMKDLSIRKVLGAGFNSISIHIFKEFTWSLCIAFLIGLPISWLFTQTIFSQFTPESKMSMIPFLTGMLSVLGMTLLSIAWHLYKANTFNPIQSLRTE